MDVNLPGKYGLVLRVIFNFSVKFLKIKILLTAMFLSSFYSAALLLAYQRDWCVVTFGISCVVFTVPWLAVLP
jgi:hypothetical protein